MAPGLDSASNRNEYQEVAYKKGETYLYMNVIFFSNLRTVTEVLKTQEPAQNSRKVT
jgi:hypothetical protein